MRTLLRLALLAYPPPLRARYEEEIAGFPVTPVSLFDIAWSGLCERGENLARDVRLACRSLLRTPGATVVSVVALALGVGANVAVYSVVRPVLLESLPFAEADRLFVLRTMTPAIPNRPTQFQVIALAHHYLDWRDQAVRFDAVEAWRTSSQTLLADDRAELVQTASLTPGLMGRLGLEPRLGRAFVPADAALDAPNIALISEGFWRTRFGAREDVVGQPLVLNEQPFEVAGVAPAALNRLVDADVWQPLRLDENGIRAGGPQSALIVLGRLAPQVSLDEGRAELDAILKANETAPYARLRGAWADTERLDDFLVGGTVKSTLELLWGAVGLVLLIALSNVAGVMLVRASARHGETGVRLALGAGRKSLLRQALTESLLLALAGGTAGVLWAYGGVRILATYLPDGFPRAEAIVVDAPALAFALGVTVALGLLLGVAPASAALRQSPAAAIRLRSAATTAGQGLIRVQTGLVAIQVAFATVLILCTGLLLHSLVRLGQVHIGVHAPETASVYVSLPRSYPEASRQAYFEELLDRVKRLPGVRSAAVSAALPLTGFAFGSAFRLPEDPQLSEEEGRALNASRMTMMNPVSEEYFQTVGARLLEGRALEPSDAAARNVVVNRALAMAAYPGASALGRRIGMGHATDYFTVVGIVEDYRQLTPRWPVELEIYAHWRMDSLSSPSTISARPTDPRQNLVSLLRDTAFDLHPAALVAKETTQGETLASKTADDRFRAGLIGMFALIAAALAGSGIFATVAFTVSRRMREIAIRRALGATPASVCLSVLSKALLTAGVGAVFGLAAAYWLRSLTLGMLFEVDPVDPRTYAAAALSLVILALAASLSPALKAARLDPAHNLRAD